MMVGLIPSALLKYFEAFSHTTWVDWVLWALVIWALIAGFLKGAEHQFVRFTSVAAAALVTHHTHKRLADFVSARFPLPVEAGEILFFFFIALGVFSLGPLVLNFIGSLVSVHLAPILSKPGGSLFAIAGWVLTFSLISYLIQLFGIEWINQSYSASKSYVGPFVSEASTNFYDFFVRLFRLLTFA